MEPCTHPRVGFQPTRGLFVFLIALLFIPVSCQRQRTGVSSGPDLTQRTYYEIFVQSFADSDGDGIGDIQGLTNKLEGIRDMGIGGIWLMPVHPSPSYHKYDVTDYYGIHPDYGTMEDFREMLEEAHSRGIAVIIDLVVNHTSDRHPWFTEAARGADNPYRDHYVWTEDTNLITREPEHWHTVPGDTSGLKYYGFFWHGMPDLNFSHPGVREEIKKIGRFWLEDVGVDGFRLDAAHYLFPEDDKEKNHAWWREFREAMDGTGRRYFMVGEVWGSRNIIAPYLSKGLHACFNFDLGFRIIHILQHGKDTDLASWLAGTREVYSQADNGYADAIFLTNHDQERIMSRLDGNLQKARVAASLLLTLPGIPFIYYGEELGMRGKKPDEQIREPYLWGDNDPAQTSWEEAVYSTPATVAPLVLQEKDEASLYYHYQKLIHLRNEYPEFNSGTFTPIESGDQRLIAFSRSHEGHRVLVLHNVSQEPVIPVSELAQMTSGKVIFCDPPDSRDQIRDGVIQPLTSAVLRITY
ncbi:MAG: DUF3459 domain-containing protein [Bacteroidales bacterium]|nr:DUF3459 domain-containing protein [Bacteroidales bacterium]